MFDSMRGATLSVLLTDLDLSYTAGGSVVMGQYAGYFAATLLVGILADRTGPKFTLVLAACSLIFGVAGYAASSGFPLSLHLSSLSGSALVPWSLAAVTSLPPSIRKRRAVT